MQQIHSTLVFQGQSGKRYEFVLHPWDAKFKSGHGGVYVLTNRHQKPDGAFGHARVFVGESADLSTAIQAHPALPQFTQQGANCVCVHASQDADERASVVRDLVEHYHPPCNAPSA